MIGYLEFSREEVFMGEGATSVEARGPYTTWRHAGRGPTPPHGVEAPWPSSDSSLDFVVVSGKIGAWLFVSSNSENISLLTFLKTKTTENTQLALWHLVNRLVLENA